MDVIKKENLGEQVGNGNIDKEHCDGESGEEEIFKKPQIIKSEGDGVEFKKPIFISKIVRTKIVKDKENKSKEPVKEVDVKTEETAPEKSPAQQLKEKESSIPYKEPPWSGVPKENYSFEVLKGGVIVDTIQVNKPFIVLGRLAQCDVQMEHPSISRFHCIIQYREKEEEGYPVGLYAYDLDSTHGSFHNKQQMKPQVYYRLNVGHILKFGGSTRMFILQGPEEDQELESDKSVTELKKIAAERKAKLEQLENNEMGDEEMCEKEKEKEKESESTDGKDEGISWGMGEDADEDEDVEENPYASANEELYLNDPKKTLRGWFEREGYDPPEYVVEEIGSGQFRCRIELPIPGPAGGPLVVIVEHKGKKKEVVIQGALEACRTLDKQGVLRQSKHESHERRKKDWAENDYYDSDEDNFLDRTGDVEKKRLKRMKQLARKEAEGPETYQSLLEKYNNLIKELEALEIKVKEAEKLEQQYQGLDDDDLDSFMLSLKAKAPDKHKRVLWKIKISEMKKEEVRLRKLTNIARKLGAPELMPYKSVLGEPVITKETKSKISSKTAAFARPSKVIAKPEEPRVHPLFREEEPERKLKLTRLDDDDTKNMPKPVKYSQHKIGPPKLKNLPFKAAAPSSPPSQSAQAQKFYTENMKEKIESKILKASKERKFQLESNNSLQSSAKGPVLPPPQPAGGGESEVLSTTQKSDRTEVEDDMMPRKRVLGPALPPDDFVKAETKTAVREDMHIKKRKKSSSKEKQSYDTLNPNYNTWVPPANQTGDGRTKLNEKLGY
ncbi:kanadaptin [Oratosquilla oratoria]|uniref:kanadaptin n=1 Tax=Oratosquilla oratoria TaxID=337810 RepID=UPI003F759269